LKVEDVELAEGEFGISFENGVSLAVYNKYESVGFSLDDARWLAGNAVADVNESADTITIRFQNNWMLRIDMRDEAYTGPEAIQLRVPSEPIVVWN